MINVYSTICHDCEGGKHLSPNDLNFTIKACAWWEGDSNVTEGDSGGTDLFLYLNTGGSLLDEWEKLRD